MKRHLRPFRAAVVLAILALPALAFAKQKMVISGFGGTWEVSCDSVKQTSGTPKTCAELCKAIDDKPFIACKIENGIMHITDNTPVDTVMEGDAAAFALAADGGVSVGLDEGTGVIHGFADHAVLGEVIDAEGNTVVDLGEIQDFTVPLYEGERLQLTSPKEPAQIELWLDGSGAPATLTPSVSDVPVAADAPTAIGLTVE